MRNLFLRILLVIIVTSGITSCSTKINTAAPYQSITMVYGILDMSDTAYYIRIQKTFLSQTISAYDMAKIPDSSFYLNLDVTVKELNKADGSVHNIFTLDKVNMNTEGYAKDSGIFFTDPSYAYKFKQAISSNYRYRLMIHNPQTGETDSAETLVLDESADPDGGFVIPFFNVANNTLLLNPAPGAQYYLSVTPPDSTLIVEGILRFHWVDKDINTGMETDRSYDWNFATTILPVPAGPNQGGNLSAYTVDFLNALKLAMGPAPVNTQRYIDSPDFYIYAGPIMLYNYEEAAAQAGIGITGNSVQPIFSNIVGKNVYGLFTTRAVRYKLSIGFGSSDLSSTLTYILNSPILQGTGLVGLSDH